MSTLKSIENPASDDLLATFDRLMDAGKTLPLAELKKRFADSDHFRYLDHKLYKTLIELPVTIDMITGGRSDSVSKIIDGLRELHGDDLMFAFDGRGGDATLQVRMWRDETALRGLWREYAEDEYKGSLSYESAA
jgi:hypothetical protein